MTGKPNPAGGGSVDPGQGKGDAPRKASVRFYGELNDFLLPELRGKHLTYRFAVPGSVKDVIEAMGAPHAEVDLILANGASVGFAYLVQPGDRIAVYPRFRSIDVSAVTQVRPPPLEEAKFVLDAHLGRLAAYLRMLGFDTLYRNDYSDEELAEISCRQSRILLTRDRGLLKRSAVAYGYCLRETAPRRQAAEVVRQFALRGAVQPFRRCLRCNALLEPAQKTEILSSLPPGAERHYQEFYRCAGCGRVYWKGSHYRRMLRLIELILER